jgi:hypothetical protein
MTVVGPLLPVVALLAIWYVAYAYRDVIGLDRLSRRGSLVVAFIVMQLLVAVISEATSIGHHFTTNRVFVAWLAVDVVVLVVAVLRFRRGPGVRVRLQRLAAGARSTSIWERVLAAIAVALLGLWTTIAWLYDVPTTGDSLVYHLSRVMHWVQNGSVHHYAAHYSAVNELSPLHEYNMAHLHVLFGSDRLDAFVQLLAVVVCVVGASEIARLLGAGRPAQILAAGFAATIPSLILEATSTQNNNFAAAVAVGLLVLLLAWQPSGKFVVVAALVGVAAGAAILTKGTLAIVIATTGVVLVVVAVVRHVREIGAATMAKRVAVSGVVAAALAVVVAGPFFARNIEVYGGLTGPTSRTTLNYDLTPNAAAANVIRSVASNFQIGDGSGPQTWVSRAVLNPLHQLYQPLGVDPADWHYLVGTHNDAFGRADYSGWQRMEAIGANPWHVVLIVVALVALVVFVARGDRRMRLPLLLGITLVVSFLLFTALARWSPYTVRYQVPLLVLWCPLIALVFERARKAVGAVLMAALLVLAWPMLLDTSTRSVLEPTWDRRAGIEPYFHTWDVDESIRAIAAGEQAVADVIADTSCKSVGLANWVIYEYPVWMALKNEGYQGRVDNFSVLEPSKVLADPNLAPCALIRQVEPDFATFDVQMVSWRFGPMTLSMPPSLVSNKSPDQAGFHSDVAGVRVLPGFNWVLGGKTPAIKDAARIHLFSDAERTVRVQAVSSSVPIEGWQQSRFGDYETSVRLKPGPNTLDLPAVQGKVSPLSGVKILPM